jgi:hypothetical protein
MPSSIGGPPAVPSDLELSVFVRFDSPLVFGSLAADAPLVAPSLEPQPAAVSIKALDSNVPQNHRDKDESYMTVVPRRYKRLLDYAVISSTDATHVAQMPTSEQTSER